MPLVVIFALTIAALTGTGSGPDSTTNPTAGALPALTPAAPSHAAAQAAACTKVLEQLPVQLGTLDPRVVHARPDTPYVTAWGDPPVILRCGAARPADLKPGSSAEFQSGGLASGPFYDVTAGPSGNIWTTVDRGPYIAIEIPTKYQAADVLPTLSTAIAKALPSVCSTDPNEPDPDKLCTRRR